MATIARTPLATRPYPQHQSVLLSPYQTVARKHITVKRPRSPEPTKDESAAHGVKRFKPVAAEPVMPTLTCEEARRQKERRRAEREQEFRVKYRRAFPRFVFYFDLDGADPEVAALMKDLEKKVVHLGARVEDFFSRDITHLITLQGEDHDKENVTRNDILEDNAFDSLIKLKERPANDATGAASRELMKKALALDIKVWSVSKLDSVLDRCQAAVAPIAAAESSRSIAPQTKNRSLTRLLENERINGTTERDPSLKRKDYKYFPKGSYFVLVEDMRQELAPIAIMEYMPKKDRDGTEHPTWPVLYCHPKSRGPFLPYDEDEERRREKADRQDMERTNDRAQRKAKLQEERIRDSQIRAQTKQHDLRRSMSLNNLRRRLSYGDPELEGLIDLDADGAELNSVNASGYLASGAYMAASGNSVGVTSTTGTTSTIGNSLQCFQLPDSLKGRAQQQVVTFRKAAAVLDETENKMGPPPTIPDRRNMLKKSRSTNTLRLPKRDEGTKPGYCESCRVKFNDFKIHIEGRRHRKFALDDANFAALDFVLARVGRRTREEVATEKEGWAKRFAGEEEQEEEAASPSHDAADEHDIQWDEWDDDDEE
ncbi:uncharacterized protein LAESUDRAFT_741371 [Laetiporus sulphureus 93-53]|uniref:DBF4-type domain-containing protein n=1 Tax=Laetiporus sulphureus 93-53 TaxID=1314785 RepID=A0A165H0J4_9APHY|nr:uncharacterized protein LAESUDRAFT_741371 [Laetiporus sulphureus 93-53]KZT11084.1 hypothetical protein LAESUDRAFT_741371 [Laetiporus sulphureus 93-53]